MRRGRCVRPLGAIALAAGLLALQPASATLGATPVAGGPERWSAAIDIARRSGIAGVVADARPLDRFAATPCRFPAEFCAFAREIGGRVWAGDVAGLLARTATITAVCPYGPEGCPGEPPGTVLRGYVGSQPGTDTVLMSRSELVRTLHGGRNWIRPGIVPGRWRLYGLVVPRGYFDRGIPSFEPGWRAYTGIVLLFTAVDDEGVRSHRAFTVASVGGTWRIVETLIFWGGYVQGSSQPLLEDSYGSRSKVVAWGSNGPLSGRRIARGSLVEIRVPRGCLRVLQRPTDSSPRVGCLRFGRIVRVDRGARSASAARWWHVRARGWVKGRFLRYYASW